MSAIKERILGAVTMMDDSGTEKVWNFLTQKLIIVTIKNKKRGKRYIL